MPIELMTLSIVCAFFLCLGWWIGSRGKADQFATTRAEGRAEVGIELARLQEKAAFLENSLLEQRQQVDGLSHQLRAATDRASSTEAECAGLRERTAILPKIQQALAAAELAAGNTTAELMQQRESNSRMNGQLEASQMSQNQLQARNAELVIVEQTLRSDVIKLNNELATERQALSRVTAQLESAGSLAVQQQRRLETCNDIEVTLRNQISERETTISQLREVTGGVRAELEGANASIQRLQEIERGQSTLQERLSELCIANTELQTRLDAERAGSQEKLALLGLARQDLSQHFKSIATEVFEHSGKRLTEQNETALGQILAPVKEGFSQFRAKLEEVHRVDGQERSALGEQLKQLVQLNQSLSTDAQNLTLALKGDKKTQGIWGEIVLDTVLEQAGLIEGIHYDRQQSFEAEDQKRSIPDIVLRLPGDRQLVIDSKVSLTAYERATTTAADDREVFIKQHITSLRNHIRVLSEKNYQQLYQLKSLDFVLLFIPLEPAFATAVSNDNQLFREAWDRNVILVSPSTLLFVVRTVAYLWKQENQAKNVIDIARRGAALYDKLCGFVEDLEDVGKRLRQTGKSYDDAMRKLAVGSGNVIGQAEKLRDLGIKPSKQLPIELVDRALSKAQQSLIGDADLDGKDSTDTKLSGIQAGVDGDDTAEVAR